MGTYAGNAYTRPVTTPAPSGTALVTTKGYQADVVQQLSVTCPPLGGASASLPTSGLAVGDHTITAIYSGDNTFPSSTGTLSSGETITSQATPARPRRCAEVVHERVRLGPSLAAAWLEPAGPDPG